MLSAEWLTKSELFAGLDAGQVEPIVGLCRGMSLPAQSIVFEEGGEARTIYLLQDGEIALRVRVRQGLEAARVSGATQPGAVVGWSALIMPHRYTAMAVTVQPSHVVAIDGAALLGSLQLSPAVGFQVMRNLAGVISGRLRNAYEQVTSSTEPGLISQG